MTKFGPWKIWNGGENPCPGKKVHVQTADETRQQAIDDPNTWDADCYIWARNGVGSDIIAYREVIEPVRRSVTMHGRIADDGWLFSSIATHRITFDLIDGEPDCASIKMERMK